MEPPGEHLHTTTKEPFDVPDPLDKVSELPQPFKFLEGVLVELTERALQQGEQRAAQARQACHDDEAELQRLADSFDYG